MQFPHFTLFLFSILGFLHQLAADVSPGDSAVLLLINGDRLQGTYEGTDENGFITFQSDILGTLQIPGGNASVEAWESPAPDTPSDAESIPSEGSVDRETEVDDTSVGSDLEEKKWVEADIPGLNWIKYPPTWTGRLRFSIDLIRREEQDSRYNFDNLINIPRERDRFQIQTRYNYETTGGGTRKIQDRYDGRVRYDHDVAENRFFQAETFYGVDRVKLIDHQLRQTVGYGMFWNPADHYELQVIPGISGTYIDQESAFEEPWLILGRIFQSFQYKFNDSYAFNQTFEGFIAADDVKNYEFIYRMGFISSITKKLALELDYEYDFNNTLAEELGRETSRFRANVVFQY